MFFVFRCPFYGSLPPGCTLTTDSKDPCCQRPNCVISQTQPPTQPAAIPTPGPGLTYPPELIPTPSKIPDTFTYPLPTAGHIGFGQPNGSMLL